MLSNDVWRIAIHVEMEPYEETLSIIRGDLLTVEERKQEFTFNSELAYCMGMESSTTRPNAYLYIYIQWRYSPRGPWPTERPPPVSEASANFCG